MTDPEDVQGPPPPPPEEEYETGRSWTPIDLGPYLRGEVTRPEPSIGLHRGDDIQLIYPGKEHSCIGEMECGKSWFALASAAAELIRGKHVIYVHFEECDPSDTAERLVALNVPDNIILERFRFVGPDQPVSQIAWQRLLDPVPSLVVLDGVNEAMSLHQQGIRDEDGAAAFRRLLVKPCTAVGAAVLSLDHVVKDREKRDRGPLGSIHKGNGLSGTLILLENAQPFGRDKKGASYVFVTKDRPGYLRRHGKATKMPGKTFMGTLVVDDTKLYVPFLDVAFIEPQDKKDEEPEATGVAAERDDDLVFTTVEKLVADEKRPTVKPIRALIRESTSISNQRVDDALERLVLADRLNRTKDGQALVYTPRT